MGSVPIGDHAPMVFRVRQNASVDDFLATAGAVCGVDMYRFGADA